jgi:hypothetical protein
MFQHLDDIELKFERLENDLADPAIASSGPKLQKLAKERAQLEPVVLAYRQYKALRKQASETEPCSATGAPGDGQEELPALKAELAALEEKLKILLIPKDPNDERGVILEIRAGTGGYEAGLFAGELMRLYMRTPSAGAGRRTSPTCRGQRRRVKESHRQHLRRLGVLEPQVRVGRAPRSERCPRPRPGPHPHLHRDRGGDARGRGRRHPESHPSEWRWTCSLHGLGRPERHTPPTPRCA